MCIHIVYFAVDFFIFPVFMLQIVFVFFVKPLSCTFQHS